jgi:predicted alpha-1,2-mannosidase
MGENGQVVLTPGTGKIQPRFQNRGLAFRKEDERSTAYAYEVLLDANSGGEFGWNLTEQAAAETLGQACPPCPGGEATVPDHVVEGANGRVRRRGLRASGFLSEDSDSVSSNTSSGDYYDRAIRVALTASAHAGYLRFDFEDNTNSTAAEGSRPYVSIQASRLNWTGHVEIDPQRQEIAGSNSQRQDYALGPDRPDSFRGYFVSRFSESFASYGVTQGDEVKEDIRAIEGKDVGAYATFDKSVERIEVRTGVSFVSIEQARKNLDNEIPNGVSFESIVDHVKSGWLEKLSRVTIAGVNETDADHDPRTIFYTGLFHALQYPNDFFEPTDGGLGRFYSGYTDSVHESNESYYQSWSIWDTFRAEHSLLTLFAPERVNPMMRSLLSIFDWTGRLPIWANMVETNIMIATNADAVLANALARGFRGFDVAKAWKAVHRNAYEPPERDTELLYFDREPHTPHEARAGLTSYLARGWVANDGWAESASRTLDYAFNDHAAAVVASHAGDDEAATALRARAGNYRHVWNPEAQFMQARNANGTWANDTWGWTEGDRWVYTFDVMHDVGGLAALFDGGKDGLLARLDEHFDGGHNLHSNEPSHHVPYLYSQLGSPARAAKQVRQLAWDNYNATAAGLSGNEDLGQMSAWYVFSALGFYPVDPASDEYIVGSPFFDEVTIRLPAGPPGMHGERTVKICAQGASEGRIYVAGLTIDGKSIDKPVIKHAELVGAEVIDFEMSAVETSWGSGGTL